MKTRLAFASLLMTVLALPLAAQEWRARIEQSLSRVKSYDFDDQAVGDVLRGVARDADVNLVVDEGAVDRFAKLTFKVGDMSIANVLTWITRLAGLRWCIQDEAVYVTSESNLDEYARRSIEERARAQYAAAERTWLPAYKDVLAKRFTVTFAQKPLSDVRDSLQALLGVNVIVSPRVDPKSPVNLALKDMTAESILGWVANKVNADFVVIDQAIYFAPPDQVRVMRGSGLDFSSRGRAYHNVVTYDFRGVPLDKAYDELARLAGIEIRIRGDISPLPAVTVSGKDESFQSAVQTVTQAAGLSKNIIVENGVYVMHLLRPAPRPSVNEPSASEDAIPAGEPARPAIEPAPAQTPAAPALEATEAVVEATEAAS